VSTPKLLLADDSVTIRKVVELTFADEGIEVSAVPDGEAAMQKFLEIHPDIVLLDTAMPGPDGYKLCEMIKQDKATRHIPVLLLVGSFEPFDQDEAERVCADGFLTKPFQSVRELVARVRELLGPEAADAEADLSEATTENEAEDVDHESVAGDETDVENKEHEAAVDALTGDIAHPYEDSYVADAPNQKFESVDELLGDSGMDDELIETVHPERKHDESGLGILGEPTSSGEEFDWSLEAKVIDGEAEEQPVEISTREEVTDKWIDEQALEPDAEHEAEQETEEVSTTASTGEAITAHEDEERVEETKAEGDVSAEPLQEEPPSEPVDEQLAEVKRVDDEAPAERVHEEPTLQHVDEKEIEPVSQDEEVSPPGSTKDALTELSPEFVNLVANRVIERISDRVIREIAREVVPRITEKLIREALEEENKS
jgi:CheY-like chemotaxis protein